MNATESIGAVVPAETDEQQATCLLCGQSLETEQVRRRYEENIGSYERLLRDQLEEDIREQVRLAEEQRLAMQVTETEEQLRKTYDRRIAQIQRTNRTLQKQLEAYKRRLDHLAPDARGALREEEVLDALRRAFPEDRIERVKRGPVGRGDILHEVVLPGRTSASAGYIVYECKNTARWNGSFVAQARAARDRHGAAHAVLISTTFPTEQRFGVTDDVVIVDSEWALPLARILRGSMIEIAKRSTSRKERQAQGEALVAYMRSTKFKSSFMAVVDGIGAAQTALAKERRQHELVWARRDALYQRVESGVAQITGAISDVLDTVTTNGAAEAVVALTDGESSLSTMPSAASAHSAGGAR